MTPQPDPQLSWAPNVLLRVEVGSTAHGTGLPDLEDYDEIGVMALPWQQSIGVPIKSPRSETIVYRPGRADDERSGPGDYDLTVHSARKFCRLAAAGNPSVLMVLFGPITFTHPDGLGDRLRGLASAFWSQAAREPFLGYARQQRERLLGVRGGKHTNRPELVAEHGYDTKYAMHMLRLGFQGVEYMRTGQFTLPIPGVNGAFLRKVRRGEVSMSNVVDLSEALEIQLKTMHSSAPEEPDWSAINDWLLDVFDWQRDRKTG